MMLSCTVALVAFAAHPGPDIRHQPPNPVILAQLGEIPEVPDFGQSPALPTFPPLRLDEMGDIPNPSDDVPWVPLDDGIAFPMQHYWCEVGDGRGCEVQGVGLALGGQCSCQVTGRIAE